jgi:hypothetical protein
MTHCHDAGCLRRAQSTEQNHGIPNRSDPSAAAMYESVLISSTIVIDMYDMKRRRGAL